MIEIRLENWTGMDVPLLPPGRGLPEGITLAELLNMLGLAGQRGYFSVLVNGRQVPLSTVLQQGDRVLLLPLMVGG